MGKRSWLAHNLVVGDATSVDGMEIKMDRGTSQVTCFAKTNFDGTWQMYGYDADIDDEVALFTDAGGTPTPRALTAGAPDCATIVGNWTRIYPVFTSTAAGGTANARANEV